MNVFGQFSDPEVLLRLGGATIMGALIGLNRNLHGKPAGMRTHALVAVASALLVVIGLKLEFGLTTQRAASLTSLEEANALSRIIQGILQGIGFLGTGVILRSEAGKRVHGLTTAASIWVSAALGIAWGLGYWLVAITAFVLVFAILVLGGPIERTLHRYLTFMGHDEDSGN